MHKILGIIPARIGSTRLPRKPLADILGESLIQRVYESCLKSKLVSDFVVATDSDEIYQHVLSFDGKAIMTSEDHQSGTTRVMEVALKKDKYDGYINIQGDSIGLESYHIDNVAEKIIEHRHTQLVVTPIYKIKSTDDIFNPNSVKVVLDKKQHALYFSRSPIPYLRGIPENEWHLQGQHWKHLGIYGFTNSAISALTSLSSAKIEQLESLEQLSWLFNGIKIECVEVAEDAISVDVPEDLTKAIELILNIQSSMEIQNAE